MVQLIRKLIFVGGTFSLFLKGLVWGEMKEILINYKPEEKQHPW